MSRTALIAGSSGLVGSALLPLLLTAPEYSRVIALGRRVPDAMPAQGGCAALLALRADFGDLGALGPQLAADDVYCCLGTTLAAAGSRAAFERVDRDYVVALARAARAQGAQRFIVVSAAGASLRSLSFYSRVKARMEVEVAALGYAGVVILRPSLLLGERAEVRPAEQLAQRTLPRLSPLLAGPLRRYRPVTAACVAAAMLTLARRAEVGVHIHHLPLENPS